MKRTAINASYILVISGQLSAAFFTGFQLPLPEDCANKMSFFWGCYYHLKVLLYVVKLHLLYFAGRLDIPFRFPKPISVLLEMFPRNYGIYDDRLYLNRLPIPGYLFLYSLSVLCSCVNRTYFSYSIMQK